MKIDGLKVRRKEVDGANLILVDMPPRFALLDDEHAEEKIRKTLDGLRDEVLKELEK